MTQEQIEKLASEHNLEIMLIPFYRQNFHNFVEAVIEKSKSEADNQKHIHRSN